MRGLFSRPPYDPTDPEGFNRPLLDHYNQLIRDLATAEHAPLVEPTHGFRQSLNGEISSARTRVECVDPEVDGVRSSADGCLKRERVPGGGEHLGSIRATRAVNQGRGHWAKTIANTERRAR